jgi:hypothetical protein
MECRIAQIGGMDSTLRRYLQRAIEGFADAPKRASGKRQRHRGSSIRAHLESRTPEQSYPFRLDENLEVEPGA